MDKARKKFSSEQYCVKREYHYTFLQETVFTYSYLPISEALKSLTKLISRITRFTFKNFIIFADAIKALISQ